MKQRPFIGPIELKVVNFGVDTLLVNFKFAGSDGKPNGGTLPEHVAMPLDEWQQVARKEHKEMPTPLEYNGKTLFIRPHGSGVWSWLLFNDDVVLSLSYGSMTGSVFCQVRFSSHLLWSIGPERALVDMQAMLFDFTKTEQKEDGLQEEAHMIYAQASEIHICADIQGWYDFTEGSIDWQHGFVSRVVNIRARPEEPTEEEQEGGMTPTQVRKLEESIKVQPVVTTTHRRIATLDFGTHGSEIMGQIYNKSAEIIKSQKSFFEEIWMAHGWDGQSIIIRNEIRYKRKGLASFDLSDAYEVLSKINQLWDYATHEWLRYVDLAASEDRNTSRLPSNCVWEAIQNAYPSDEEVGHLDTEREQEARIKRLIDKKPVQVLAQAQAITLEASLPDDIEITHEELAQLETGTAPHTYARAVLTWAFLCFNVCSQRVSERIKDNTNAIEETLSREPLAVVRAIAREELDRLEPGEKQQLVNHLSPEPFEEVQATLMKRARRMAKKKACVAALAGYLSSIMALSVEEVASEPDLMASMRVAIEEVAMYNKSRGRSHLGQVWEKRLKYGFVTAKQVEEERRVHGLDLSDDDWSKVQEEIDLLKRKAKDNDRSSRHVA